MRRVAAILMLVALLAVSGLGSRRDECGDCMEAAQQFLNATYSACLAGGGNPDYCDAYSRNAKCAYGATHCGSCSWIDMLIDGGFCLN